MVERDDDVKFSKNTTRSVVYKWSETSTFLTNEFMCKQTVELHWVRVTSWSPHSRLAV